MIPAFPPPTCSTSENIAINCRFPNWSDRAISCDPPLRRSLAGQRLEETDEMLGVFEAEK